MALSIDLSTCMDLSMHVSTHVQLSTSIYISIHLSIISIYLFIIRLLLVILLDKYGVLPSLPYSEEYSDKKILFFSNNCQNVQLPLYTIVKIV